MNQIENELQGWAKNREDVEAYRRSEPLAELVAAGNQAEAALGRLRRMPREMQTLEAPRYQERVREIDREIGEAMAQLNRGVVERTVTNQCRSSKPAPLTTTSLL